MARFARRGRRGVPAAIRSGFRGGRRAGAIAGLATTALLALSSHPAQTGATLRTARSTHAPVRCVAAIQHPLSVRIEALDPIRRGGAVRLRVTTSSRVAFERGEVLMSSTGGTAAAGSLRAALRAVPAGGQAAADFAVVVPRGGHRFVLQFRVQTEGREGSYARGATYNLLPEGPSEHGRIATTAGGQAVIEVPATMIEP